MADLNPQAKQMADQSMVRNLNAQARAIWPQEMPLFKRYGLPANPQILDAGCGTGKLTSRLAELFPSAKVLGSMKLEDITVDYIVVDTLRTPRETFATTMEAWRDGYAQSIGDLTPITEESA